MKNKLKKRLAFLLTLIMILCNTLGYASAEEQNISVTLDINTDSICSKDGLSNFGIEPILTTGSVTLFVPKDSSAFDVFKKVADERGISYTANNTGYISEIGWAGNNLSKDDDPNNPFGISINSSIASYPGWMYLVNGEEPPVGANDYKLSDGDHIEFKYGIINIWNDTTFTQNHYDWEFIELVDKLKAKIEEAKNLTSSGTYTDSEKAKIQDSIDKASSLTINYDTYMGLWIAYFAENPVIWGGENSEIGKINSSLIELDNAINKVIEVESVEFPETQKNLEIKVGEKIQLKAYALPQNSNQILKYEVITGEKYIKLTEMGMLEGLESYDGLIMIKASSKNGKSNTIKLKVIASGNQEKVTYKEALSNSLKYIKTNISSPKLNDEWAVFSVLRNIESDVSGYGNKYIENLSKTDLLKVDKTIDISRIIIAVTSAGKDVENIGGQNILNPLSDFNEVKRNGINGTIYALIALDSGKYNILESKSATIQNSRDLMILEIMNNELNGGGWALSGNNPDADITSMALQALAPYYEKEYIVKGKSVKAYVDRAVAKLAEIQTAEGEYSSAGVINSCSSAQVLTALSELKIDPLKDSRFIKGKNNIVDVILNYYVADGGFKFTSKYGVDDMATQQCAYALTAYNRFINQKNRIYDMSDVEFNAEKTVLEAQIKVTEQMDKRDYTFETWENLEKALLNAKTVKTNVYAKQGEIDRATVKLEDSIKLLKLKIIEKPKLENGKIEIPLDSSKNFEIEIKKDEKAKIIIPENAESKIVLKTETKKPLAEIRVQKGNNEFKIPEGTQIEKGNAEIELFIMKSESQKSQIKEELSDKVKKLDPNVKDIKVEDAFKLGNTDKIEFSDYVELIFTNMAGKGAAYVDNTGMHIIERVTNDAEGIGKSEYAFDRGADLVVKTKHFTDFVTYSVQKDTGNTGGTGGGLPSKDLTVNLSIDKKTINKGYVINPTSIKINKGDTVWDVTKKVMDENNISYNYKGSGSSVYISDIAGDGEFDHGKNSGWMYSVNGSFTKDGSGQYKLNGGETIQWRYTTNLGEDLGADNSSFKSNNVVSNEAEKGSTIVKAEAKVDKKEAKVEVDSKRIIGAVKEAVEKKLTQIVIEPTVEDKKAEFNKVSVVLEKESIEKIAKEAKTSLKLKTKFGDVKLFANTLENLLKEKGNTVTISIKQNEDNSVNVEVRSGLDSLDKISGGMIVTLPVSEASVSNIMVKVADDNTEQILMKSVSADKVLSAKLDGSTKVKIVQREVDFADTSAHWAKENIEFVSARDIIKGTKANEFSPNSSVNRAMLTTILHRFENEMQVEGQNYSDVTKDAYYANAALWAKTKGIVSDTDKFEAKEELTREQLAQMIYNYAKASGENVSNISKANVQKFEDFSTIDSASQDAVAYCYEKGIIGGKSETKLDPKGKTTRAEVSAIIQRYIVNSVK